MTTYAVWPRPASTCSASILRAFHTHARLEGSEQPRVVVVVRTVLARHQGGALTDSAFCSRERALWSSPPRPDRQHWTYAPGVCSADARGPSLLPVGGARFPDASIRGPSHIEVPSSHSYPWSNTFVYTCSTRDMRTLFIHISLCQDYRPTLWGECPWTFTSIRQSYDDATGLRHVHNTRHSVDAHVRISSDGAVDRHTSTQDGLARFALR